MSVYFERAQAGVLRRVPEGQSLSSRLSQIRVRTDHRSAMLLLAYNAP